MEVPMDEQYEKIKKTLDDKSLDSTFFSSVIGSDQIPLESLGFLGANTTLDEFLRELNRRGLTVTIAPSNPAPPNYEPTPEEVEQVPLSPVLENSAKTREHYLKLREMAQEKLGETGYIQSLLEQEASRPDLPVDEAALEKLNAASYQGDFGELRELSKELKKESAPKGGTP